VYFFSKSNGEWRQQARFAPQDGSISTYFSYSVAISADGTTAAAGVSVRRQSDGPGSVYVFSKASGSWEQEEHIESPEYEPEGLYNDPFDGFASDIGLSKDGSTILIGAASDEEPNGDYGGSVHVFKRTNGTWEQQTKFGAENGGGGDLFGNTVALSGDGQTAFVGALGTESIHVFSQSEGNWAQETILDGGQRVSISDSGDTAAVGPPIVSGPYEDQRPVSVYSRSNRNWTQAETLISKDADAYDGFGSSVAVSGDGSTIVVGAPSDEDPNGSEAGSAYVFSQSSGYWAQSEKLVAADGDSSDSFGSSVGVSDGGETALVGARFDEDPNGKYAGSAYTFDLAPSSTEETTGGTGRLQIGNAIGTDIRNNTVATVELVVTSQDGSTDLSGVTGQWVGPSGVYTVTADNFGITVLQDDNESLRGQPPVLEPESDRAKLVIDISSFSRQEALSPGEEVSLYLQTATGKQTEVQMTVPDTLTGEDSVSVT
jgi:hypothetical protein